MLDLNNNGSYRSCSADPKDNSDDNHSSMDPQNDGCRLHRPAISSLFTCLAMATSRLMTPKISAAVYSSFAYSSQLRTSEHRTRISRCLVSSMSHAYARAMSLCCTLDTKNFMLHHQPKYGLYLFPRI